MSGSPRLSSGVIIRERLGRLLRSSVAPEYAAGLALLLALPSLGLGWILDDHLMPKHARDGAPPWDRFHFAEGSDDALLREDGVLGWWSGEQFGAHFMRPLSSLSHALDFALWPEAAWLMHLENVLLYTLLTWLVARLIQRVHGSGLAAGVGAFVFAVDETHAATVSWITGRNTMLAVLFGVLAMHAHLRWRAGANSSNKDGKHAKRRSFASALAACACFALALACAEAGVCVFGYVVAWSLVRERGPWVRRLLPTLPYVALIVVWQAFYIGLGFGATDSLIYLDAGAHPLRAAANIATYPPSLAVAQLSLPVTDLLLVAPWSWVVLVPLFGVLVWALAPVLGVGQGRVWLLGMLFAAIPFAATTPSMRLMMILGLGGAPLIGLCVAARAEQTPEIQRGRVRRAVIGLMLVANIWLAPLAFVGVTLSSAAVEPPHRALAKQVPEQVEVCVILNVATEINALYPKAMRETEGRAWPGHVYVLFAGREPVEIERVGPRTLELYSEAGWAATPIDRLSRDWSRGFAPGDKVTLAQAHVEVLEIVDVGEYTRPRRIRVSFERDLDAIALLGFGRDGGEGLARWRPGLGERAVFQARLL